MCMDELKECKYLLPMAKEQMEIKMMLQQMACKQRVFQMVIFSPCINSFRSTTSVFLAVCSSYCE